MLYEKFNNEIEVYRFLNRISKDKLVRVISVLRLSGPEEGKFELYYEFVDKNVKEVTMTESEQMLEKEIEWLKKIF